MNKTVVKIISIIAVAAVIALFLFTDILSSPGNDNALKESSSPKPPSGIIIDALVTEFQQFNNELTLTGSLQSNEAVQLASETSGKVEKIYFQEGGQVQKGQLLVSTNIDDLIANLKRLNYQADLNKSTERRLYKLLEKDAISKEEYDIAYTNLKVVEAQIAEVEAQIEKSRIRAPFSGRVGLRYISEGSYITTSTQIASIYSVDPIKIEFSIPSQYSNLIAKGNEISFSSEAEKSNRKATVYAIEPQIDPVTRTLTVRAQCANPNNTLIPGQFVRVNLTLDSSNETILVPTTSIMPNADGHAVYRIENGTAYLQQVELGYRTPNQVEILSGLNAGDTVATAGVPQLKDRARVEIKNLERK